MISAVSHRLPAGADSPFWANDYDNEKPRRIQRLAFAAALAAIVKGFLFHIVSYRWQDTKNATIGKTRKAVPSLLPV
jgi:hypothetical protein